MRIIIITEIINGGNQEFVFLKCDKDRLKVENVENANLIIAPGPCLKDNSKKIKTLQSILGEDDWIFYHVGGAQSLDNLRDYNSLREIINNNRDRVIEYSEAVNKEIQEMVRSLIGLINDVKKNKKDIIEKFDKLCKEVECKHKGNEEKEKWGKVKSGLDGLEQQQRTINNENIILLMDPGFEGKFELYYENGPLTCISGKNCSEIIEKLKELRNNQIILLAQLMFKSNSGFNVKLKTLDYPVMEIIYHIVNDDDIKSKIKAIYLFGVLQLEGKIQGYMSIFRENRFDMMPFHNINENCSNIENISQYIEKEIDNLIPNDASHFIKLLKEYLGKNDVNDFLKHFYPGFKLSGKQIKSKDLNNLAEEDIKIIEYALMKAKTLKSQKELKKRKLYIIDDDGDLRKRLVEKLKERYANVTGLDFKNVEQEISSITDKDIILIDLFEFGNQLRRTGFEIAKRIKQEKNSTVLAFTSISAYDPLTEIMKSRSFDGIVIKPKVKFDTGHASEWNGIDEVIVLESARAIQQEVKILNYSAEHFKKAIEWFNNPGRIVISNEDDKKTAEIIIGCLGLIKLKKWKRIGVYRTNLYKFLNDKGLRHIKELKRDPDIIEFFKKNNELIEKVTKKLEEVKKVEVKKVKVVSRAIHKSA